MKLIYRHQKDKTKIFGRSFVMKNKKALKMIINNQMKDLEEETFFGDIEKPKIKLIGLRNVYDFSFMFHNCSSLLEISNSLKCATILSKKNLNEKLIERNNKINILTNFNDEANKLLKIKTKFSINSSLNILPNISEWETKNVKNMNSMFY